jgi:hypothetical protein
MQLGNYYVIPIGQYTSPRHMLTVIGLLEALVSRSTSFWELIRFQEEQPLANILADNSPEV